MARGARIPLEEKLDRLDQKIRSAEQRLEALQLEKETLLNRQREQAVGALYDLIQEKSLSVSQVKAMLET